MLHSLPAACSGRAQQSPEPALAWLSPPCCPPPPPPPPSQVSVAKLAELFSPQGVDVASIRAQLRDKCECVPVPGHNDLMVLREVRGRLGLGAREAGAGGAGAGAGGGGAAAAAAAAAPSHMCTIALIRWLEY
jgi:hypothetical protein